MLELISRRFAYPLWDLKDRSVRLKEHRRLLESQWQLREQVEERQLNALKATVAYAFGHCPYYASVWRGRPDIRSFDDFRRLPLLSKQAVRAAGEDLVSTQYSPSKLVEARTGGSTGTALRVFFDGRCQEKRNAAAMRSDGWAGWKPGMLVAALWGTPPVPKGLKERVRNALHDRLMFLDTMNLNDATMGEFARRMVRRRPSALFGHAHSLFVFCRFLHDHSVAIPRPRAVIATSMMLLETERRLIEEVLGCKVTNRYGCEEVGLIASECSLHSGLHVNAEHVYVEILKPDGSRAAAGEPGQIVVTDLLNRGMPLIRYAIEDTAAWSETSCACGRGLPLIEKLLGRMADFLVRQDGGQVAGVSLVEKTLTSVPGVEQMQIVQKSLTHFVLNVVKTADYSRESGARLVSALESAFGGGIEVEIRLLSAIPQERNGKYRFAIRELPE